MDQPVCTRCFRPISPHRHYCECGQSAGAHTLYLPWESIPAEVDFLGRMWKRVRNGPGIHWRVGGAVLLLLMVPSLLLVLPVVLIRRKGNREASSGTREA